MVLYGITGGLGMGKSTVASMLSASGMALLDTDDIARSLTAKNGPALAEIAAVFGGDAIGSDGTLNRSVMAGLIFANPSARRELEAILHPRIRASWHTQVGQWRQAGVSKAAVVIPLLYETGGETAFDHVVCVACSEATQAARCASRGWPDGQLAARNKAQWPVAKKMELAEFVLWNEGDSTVLKRQLKPVFDLN